MTPLKNNENKSPLLATTLINRLKEVVPPLGKKKKNQLSSTTLGQFAQFFFN